MNRKLSMMIFGLIALTIIICGTVVSIHFEDPKWFEYGTGSILTALLLIGFFGWPIND